ncbi:prepilin-type N-terminal cleavage/methylation domain-containing protein [Dyella kyungheensis]|uniref:Prepilin-type N-terminal cleavage/methylation domain-containing protein n=1 Tax=Dyella kyungheensis TaxID=1242174 RepID=A0ABS2JWM1_9GAMM|nr:prepilin-type N-terminal cleavage/methylation domain-containing protein [Dyella kyungheensis]MBM7123427.1 prepilin-type N-terminal cleavage/methylation domain-containing protein [Dyella kyungheensis]
MKRVRGFSLLEVLSALALLSILLVGVLSGIRTATKMVGAGSRAMEQVDEMRSAQRFIRHDLLQARAIPWKVDGKGVPIVFEGDEQRIQFVGPLPGYLDRNGPQLQTLALASDGNGAFQLELSSDGMSPTGATHGIGFSPEPLAEGIARGRFRYYGSVDGKSAKAWMNQWHVAGRMPELVSVELQRGDDGEPWLLVQTPIRQSADAVNSRALARLLPNATQY